MRAVRVVIGLLVSCGSHDDPMQPPTPKHPAHENATVVDATLADAAAISTVPAPQRDPTRLCDVQVKARLGMIRIRADKDTQRGELEAFNASTAPSRHLLLVARTAGSEITFVFDGYAKDDSTFKGHAVPRHDHLARGTDIVARIVATATGERRLYVDGAFRLAEGFDPPHDGGYYVCE